MIETDKAAYGPATPGRLTLHCEVDGEPGPLDVLSEELTQVLCTDGRLAAIRYLRRRMRRLGVVDARRMVLAVELGEALPTELDELLLRPRWH